MREKEKEMLTNFFQECTETVLEVLRLAVEEMIKLQRQEITPELILLGIMLLESEQLSQVFEDVGLDARGVRNMVIREVHKLYPVKGTRPSSSSFMGAVRATPQMERYLRQVMEERRGLGEEKIGLASLFLALFCEDCGQSSAILRRAGLRYDRLREVFERLHRKRDQASGVSSGREEYYDVLRMYTKDLTELARQGHLDPVVGRQKELDRLIRILARRRKNNPVLLGEPGVGKTCLVEGLAQAIVEERVPEHLVGKRILQLEMAALVAGAKFRGEFEGRLKEVRDEVIAAKGEIILFIDELQTLVSSAMYTEGGVDGASILKPALARGDLRCIATSTLRDYKRYVERDKAFERRFQPIYLQEPSVEEAVEILKALAPRYEGHYKVFFTREALEASVLLSSRYITDRFLPDKAVDLMDEAGAQKFLEVHQFPEDLRRLKRKKRDLEAEKRRCFQEEAFEEAAKYQMELAALEERLEAELERWRGGKREVDFFVQREDVARVASQWTGIPLTRLVEDEAEKLLRMEAELHRRIVSQHRAVEAVSQAIRRNRVGLREGRRPIGSFLFLGPTGVGKTELAKALAEFLFEDESRMIRLDMSEYMERHEVSKLIGAPPGYVGYGEGGQLTERVRRNPYSVVLLDELEKAHGDVFHAFLQILDEGHLTDAQGQRVSFQNTVIICTSNVGSHLLRLDGRGIGFKRSRREWEEGEVERLVLEEVKRVFRPEFLNRLDELIVFQALTLEDMREIVRLELGKIISLVEKKGFSLEVSAEVEEWLAREGYDPEYGARPLRRVIEKYLVNPLSIKILENSYEVGRVIRVELGEGELLFS